MLYLALWYVIPGSPGRFPGVGQLSHCVCLSLDNLTKVQQGRVQRSPMSRASVAQILGQLQVSLIECPYSELLSLFLGNLAL